MEDNLFNFNINSRSTVTFFAAEGDIPQTYSRRPCFGVIVKSDIFRNAVSDNKKIKESYRITIYKSNAYTSTNHNPEIDSSLRDSAHCCLFSFDEIIEHLEYIKSITPFEYELEEHEFSYTLKLRINDLPLCHKFILTFMRYIYEYPFTFILQDAKRLGNVYGFKNLSLINRVILVSNTNFSTHGEVYRYSLNPSAEDGLICLATNRLAAFIGKEELYKRLHKKGEYYLNYAFDYFTDIDYYKPFRPYREKEPINNFYEWNKKQNFEKRCIHYKECLASLKYCVNHKVQTLNF